MLKSFHINIREILNAGLDPYNYQSIVRKFEREISAAGFDLRHVRLNRSINNNALEVFEDLGWINPDYAGYDPKKYTRFNAIAALYTPLTNTSLNSCWKNAPSTHTSKPFTLKYLRLVTKTGAILMVKWEQDNFIDIYHCYYPGYEPVKQYVKSSDLLAPPVKENLMLFKFVKQMNEIVGLYKEIPTI